MTKINRIDIVTLLEGPIFDYGNISGTRSFADENNVFHDPVDGNWIQCSYLFNHLIKFESVGQGGRVKKQLSCDLLDLISHCHSILSASLKIYTLIDQSW